MSHRNPALDDVRGLAALLVVFAHGAPLLAPLIDMPTGFPLIGTVAVELFFALSGFLVGGLILAAPRHDASWFAVFMMRRWLRTLPAYAVFLVLAIVVARWLGETLPPLLPYATMTQNLWWAPPTFFPVSWSLTIEEIFYLLAAITAVVLAPWRKAIRVVVLALLLAGAIAIRLSYAISHHDVSVPNVFGVALLRLDAIFYGVLAVAVHRLWPADAVRARNALAMGGLSLLCVTMLALSTGVLAESPVGVSMLCTGLPCAFAMMLPAIAAQGERRPADAMLAPLRATATISYPLYLGHRLCEFALLGLGVSPDSAGDAVAAFAIYVFASLTLARWAHVLIERPILARRDAWGRVITAAIDRLRARPAAIRSAPASAAGGTARAAK